MKKFFLAAIAAIATLPVWSVNPKMIEIAPTDSEGEKSVLELSLPAGEVKGAVVVCPGGGYGFKAIDKEGRDWVDWFAERGIATAVLDYRLPHHRHAVPSADCSASIAYLRANATKLGIPADKIGVMGFSAGGHLAATAATHFDEASRPDFQILMYPVISLDLTITHPGTRENLIGKDPKPGLEALYSIELQVTPQTPPAFIFACEDDGTVPVENSLLYFRSLTAAKVPSQLHIFPTGGHGFGKLPQFKYVDQMLYLLDSWIKTSVLAQ